MGAVLDTLSEMHLALREFGWVAVSNDSGHAWKWCRPGVYREEIYPVIPNQFPIIWTFRHNGGCWRLWRTADAEWDTSSPSVGSLRRVLREIAAEAA